MPLGRSSCRRSYCASTTLSIFHVGMKSRAAIQPEAEGTLTLSLMCLGELHGRELDSIIRWGRVRNAHHALPDVSRASDRKNSTPPNGRRLLHPSHVRRNEMRAVT